MSRIRLTWNNASTTIVEQRVYRSISPLDIDDMPDPLAVLPRRSREYLDSTIEGGLTYYYAVSSVLPDYSELISAGIKVEASPQVSDPHWDKVVALLHFDGDFTDETGLPWTVVGNAVIAPNSGIQGTGCYSGDGRNDYIRASSPELILGSGDFTIEGFTHMLGSTYNGTNAASCLVDMRNSEPSANILLDIADNGTLRLYFNGSYVIDNQSSMKLRDGLTHWAMERYGNNLMLFVGGALAGTYAFSGSLNNNTITLGGRYAAVSGDFRSLNGLIDEFRITKGVARYTENFAPPTEPFPNN